MIMTRPSTSEHAPYYASYIALVLESDVLKVLDDQAREIDSLLKSIPEEQASVLHPPYTWTIKQVVGHLIDAERVFAYRSLRFGRGDAQALPGFDENIYARTGEFDRLPLRALVAEYAAVRQNTLHLLRHLPESAWARTGVANGAPASVRALAFIIAGHTRHHLGIVRKRLATSRIAV